MAVWDLCGGSVMTDVQKHRLLLIIFGVGMIEMIVISALIGGVDGVISTLISLGIGYWLGRLAQ